MLWNNEIPVHSLDQVTTRRQECHNAPCEVRMAITIRIPPNIEQDLRRRDPKLDESAREQFIIANDL